MVLSFQGHENIIKTGRSRARFSKPKDQKAHRRSGCWLPWTDSSVNSPTGFVASYIITEG